jgi:transcription initiation factor IIE alpha subunit
VICSSVVGQLRWKEHIKKHKKFLIFLINKLVSYLCAKLETMTELLSILYKLRIFTSDELSEALKGKVKSVEALLARYKQQGWIVAIRRNTYCMKDIASGLPVCNK